MPVKTYYFLVIQFSRIVRKIISIYENIISTTQQRKTNKHTRNEVSYHKSLSKCFMFSMERINDYIFSNKKMKFGKEYSSVISHGTK